MEGQNVDANPLMTGGATNSSMGSVAVAGDSDRAPSGASLFSLPRKFCSLASRLRGAHTITPSEQERADFAKDCIGAEEAGRGMSRFDQALKYILWRHAVLTVLMVPLVLTTCVWDTIDRVEKIANETATMKKALKQFQTMEF